MEQYIKKSAVIAEIDRLENKLYYEPENFKDVGAKMALDSLKFSLNTLEVKEVDEQKERMNECPYRQVGCTMYEGHILECRGACSWVADYPRLKELKAQKGEEV